MAIKWPWSKSKPEVEDVNPEPKFLYMEDKDYNELSPFLENEVCSLLIEKLNNTTYKYYTVGLEYYKNMIFIRICKRDKLTDGN